MLFSGIFSLKSIVSFGILLISIVIGGFLYLTLNDDFETQPRERFLKSAGSESVAAKISGSEFSAMINSAREAWSIINQNRPIVDIQTSYGNALPPNVKDPYELEQWKSPPASHSFTINVYNRLKQRVLQFTYSLQYTYGGSLNGKGAYLDRVTIIPSRISVAWAFVFNASVQIASVHNIGTIDDPIAAVHLELKYSLVGLNTIERTESFHITGEGNYVHLNA